MRLCNRVISCFLILVLSGTTVVHAQFSEAESKKRSVRITYSFYNGAKWVVGANHATGFILTEKGHILTAAHIVEERAAKTILQDPAIWQKLSFDGEIDGKKYKLDPVQLYPGAEDALLLVVSEDDVDGPYSFFPWSSERVIPATREIIAWGFPRTDLSSRNAHLRNDCDSNSPCIIDEKLETSYSGGAMLHENAVVGMAQRSATTVSPDSKFIHIGRLSGWLSGHIELPIVKTGDVSKPVVLESIPGLTKAARNQYQVLLANSFFAELDFEAAIGGYQSSITRICDLRTEERSILDKGDENASDLQQVQRQIDHHKRNLASGRSKLPEIKSLNQNLAVQVDYLNRLVHLQRNGGVAPTCVENAAKQLEGFSSVTTLIANWVDMPREPTCGAATQLIKNVSALYSAGETFAGAPLTADQCLGQSGYAAGQASVDIDYPVSFLHERHNLQFPNKKEFKREFQARSGYRIASAIFAGEQDNVEEESIEVTDDGSAVTVVVTLESGPTTDRYVGKYDGNIVTTQSPKE